MRATVVQNPGAPEPLLTKQDYAKAYEATKTLMAGNLDDAAKAAGRLKTREDLEEAVMHGAVMRLRPKLMTILANIFGLFPVMWATGSMSPRRAMRARQSASSPGVL